MLAPTVRRVCVLLVVTIPAFAQTYTLQTSNTTENLRGISTPSDKVAWAGGAHGTYLRTTDGGKTWVAGQVPDAESFDFRARRRPRV